MRTSTIRTTCGTCQLTFDVPLPRLVLGLPTPSADPGREPTFVCICPRCGCGTVTGVTWRTATYLLAAGSTTITAPDDARLRPVYPERRPRATTPMTLDDLIDLHVALEADLACG